LKTCIDTNALVSLLRSDAHGIRAPMLISHDWNTLTVSDLAGAEFPAAVARRVRTAGLGPDEANAMPAAFDALVGTVGERVAVTPAGIAGPAATFRRLDLPLRAMEAIHLALPARLGSSIGTLDQGMAAAGRVLSVAVVRT